VRTEETGTPEEAGLDLDATKAELRSAIQHRDAAVQKMRETQQELAALIQRARELLGQD
jgi:hypothetical protein